MEILVFSFEYNGDDKISKYLSVISIALDANMLCCDIRVSTKKCKTFGRME